MVGSEKGSKVQLFNPGEFVFLKGKVLSEFFAVKKGSFALLEALESAPDATPIVSPGTRIKKVLDKPLQLFGEIGALLKEPQNFSVVALTPSEVERVPTVPEEHLNEALFETPGIGLRICTSFARKLKASIDLFVSMLGAQTSVGQLVFNSCRAFQSLLNELERLPSAVLGSKVPRDFLSEIKEHPLALLARELETAPAAATSSSVSSCVIRPPAGQDKVQSFPKGSCLCKKGTLGNRLFLLTEGTVEVAFSPTSSLRMDEPGTIIGEIAVLLNMDLPIPDVKRTADVFCVTPVQAVVLGMEDIENYVDNHPEFVTKLVDAIVERTRNTLRLIEQERQDLNDRIFSKLRICLEGHHLVAKTLHAGSAEPSLNHPFNLAAQQSRQIYDRFVEIKELLARQPNI